MKINLSHPDKILYPEGKITKLNVAEYYESIHDWILPYIVNRPLTLVRCPDNYKACFFQRHINNKPPEGVAGIKIQEKHMKDNYVYIKNEAGLLSLSQLNVLEIHPWGSQVKNVTHPDIIVFDLDPAPKLPWAKVVEAAFAVKQVLKDFKLRSYVKTTGGKGLHVVVPIKPEYSWDQVKNFSHVLVDYLVMNHPNQYIGTMTKSKRHNKIFIDYLRNQQSATSIAPYSLRARKFAPVATPVDWDELTSDIEDTFFTINTLPKRLEHLKKDPWRDFFKKKQSLHLDKLK
jgi:bifunctional non-homologous end joining protein LigD